MPLYEYLCDACGHRFEVIQKYSDALVDTCPSCGAPVRKLQSAPAIQFKGTGWYVTDYAKKEHVTAMKADNASRDAETAAKPKTDSTSSPASDSAPSTSPAASTGSSSTKDS